MQVSLETTGKSRQHSPGWLADQTALAAAAVILVLVLCLPVITTSRAPINSDQSLYLAEALNIAEGRGLTYSTGEPITHRSPAYPALLAGAFKLEGLSLDSAYLVPRLSIIANALLLFLLGRALFGGWAGLAAGVAAAASPYLRGLGTTLYLDSTQTAFLLAALLVYWRGGWSVRWMAGGGALLGVSFLIKESSVLFLPLPVVIAMLYGFEDGWKRALPAWFAGFAAVTSWWFVWAYAHTGTVYLVGEPQGHLALALAAAATFSIGAAMAMLRFAPASFHVNRLTLPGAALVLLVWNGLFFAGLEHASWHFDSNYAANVTRYVTSIFLPNVQPAPLVLAAWAWAFWSSPRSRAAGIVVTCALLYASFFILVADRGLSLRDQLPVVYMSYLALGGAAAWLVAAGASVDLGVRIRALGGGGAIAVVAALAAVVMISGGSLYQARTTSLQDDWDNALSRQTAAWLQQNLERGSTVMSSRLYYSHLYFLTGGAFPIHQLPTVEVDLDTTHGAALPVSRRSTLFRWENDVIPADMPGEPWLYLTRYPVKGYFIGLAEDDLLADLRGREIDYVVLSTLDAGFSSPSFNAYFQENPAFDLVHTITATPQDEVRIYRVDRAKLAPKAMPAQITASAYEYIVRRLSGERAAADYLKRVNPAGFRLTER